MCEGFSKISWHFWFCCILFCIYIYIIYKWQNVASAKHENKVLAINKNSLGWSGYLHSFLLILVCRSASRRSWGRKQWCTGCASLSEWDPTGPEHCQQSWELATVFNDISRKGEGINQVHHSSRVQTGSPTSRNWRQDCGWCNVDHLWAGDSNASAQSWAEMELLRPWERLGVPREIKASLFTHTLNEYLPRTHFLCLERFYILHICILFYLLKQKGYSWLLLKFTFKHTGKGFTPKL